MELETELERAPEDKSGTQEPACSAVDDIQTTVSGSDRLLKGQEVPASGHQRSQVPGSGPVRT